MLHIDVNKYMYVYRRFNFRFRAFRFVLFARNNTALECIQDSLCCLGERWPRVFSSSCAPAPRMRTVFLRWWCHQKDPMTTHGVPSVDCGCGGCCCRGGCCQVQRVANECCVETHAIRYFNSDAPPIAEGLFVWAFCWCPQIHRWTNQPTNEGWNVRRGKLWALQCGGSVSEQGGNR